MNLPKEIEERIIWSKTKQPGDYPYVAEIKHDPKPCEDCGDIVVDRQIRTSVSKSQNHHSHCKHHCLACKLYKNPVTGKFDMAFAELNSYYQISTKKNNK